MKTNIVEIIPAGTAASVGFVPALTIPHFFNSQTGSAPIPPTFWAVGLGVGEEIEIQVPARVDPTLSEDSHWSTFDRLTQGDFIRTSFGCAPVRVKKPVTTASVSVLLARP